MFNFIKEQFKSIYTHVTTKLSGLFSRTSIDQESLKELEKILIEADVGIAVTKELIQNLSNSIKEPISGIELKQLLHDQLLQIAQQRPYQESARVYVLVGINGSGKTTFAGKLANYYRQKGKKVLLIAADTFRAAAREQLAAWATATQSTLVQGAPEQDPASVVFKGCEEFKKNNADIMIIDTAGRLQTKVNLMKELEKISRIINKQLPDIPTHTLLTVDAMLGQNSFEQAQLFNESTKLDGIVLTKMDGTGKGGIVFAITSRLKIPVAFISYGEKSSQLIPFDPQQYVYDLLAI